MVSGFRAWTAQADAMAEKYAAPPGPIDFASAKKSVRDVALVESLEKMYTSSSPAPLTYEWSKEDQDTKSQLIEDAKAGLAFTQEMIEDTEREIAYLRTHRTTREVSTSDMKEIYPDIAEEVEKEIENREWFKDTLNK
jgi:L-2-hydroxyglutarate oxidase LhgO